RLAAGQQPEDLPPGAFMRLVGHTVVLLKLVDAGGASPTLSVLPWTHWLRSVKETVSAGKNAKNCVLRILGTMSSACGIAFVSVLSPAHHNMTSHRARAELGLAGSA